jgi:hypothetical protein
MLERVLQHARTRVHAAAGQGNVLPPPPPQHSFCQNAALLRHCSNRHVWLNCAQIDDQYCLLTSSCYTFAACSYLGGNLLRGNLPASWGNTLKPVEL